MLKASHLSQFTEKLINRRNAIIRFRRILDTSHLSRGAKGRGGDDRTLLASHSYGPVGLNTRERKEIEDIDRALCRIYYGIYGVCEECKGAISLERLESLPATRVCTSCAIEKRVRQDKHAVSGRRGTNSGRSTPVANNLPSLRSGLEWLNKLPKPNENLLN